MFIRRAPAAIIRTLAVIGFGYTIVGTATPGRADEGRCLIKVNGRTFLKGTCNIEIRAGGSFTVGVGDQSRSKHFAYVNLDSTSGKAQAYWNGSNPGNDHAGELILDELTRRGACWSNNEKKKRKKATTMICAWREK